MNVRNTLLPLAAAASLFLFSGSASAELRSFEFSGTVTYTSDASLAAVGTVFHGRFSYDDATAPAIDMPGYASYQLPTYISATINGHSIVSDRLGVDLWNDFGHYTDFLTVYGYPAMVDDTVLVDGGFSFTLGTTPKVTNVLNDTRLPVSFDVSAFDPSRSYGELRTDGSQTGTLLQFSIDSIVDDCRKVNGKTAKNNCAPN